MKFTRHLFFSAWSLLSVLLLGLYLASVLLHMGTAFFVILNILNALLALLYVLFKRRIENSLKALTDIYGKFINEKRKFHIIVEYKNEIYIGRLLIGTVSLFGGYVIILSLQDIEAYRHLISEDSYVEYSSSLFWFLAALILSFSYIRSSSKNKIYNQNVLPYLLLSLFFLVCAGEEISWGQRIFNLGTPDYLKAINVQNEITLHNIGSISIFSNAFFFLTVIFFILVPYVRVRNTGFRQFTDFYAMPNPNIHVVIVYCISLGIWFIIGVRFGTLGFHPFSFYAENYYTQMDDEIFEFLAAYSFLCFSIMEAFKETRLERYAE